MLLEIGTGVERLGIAARNAAQATVVINRTLDADLIRVADPDHSRAGYVPHWAREFLIRS